MSHDRASEWSETLRWGGLLFSGGFESGHGGCKKASRLRERLFGRRKNGLKSSTTFSLAAAAVFGAGGGLLRTLADVGVEDALAQTDVERGGFDELVGIDVFDGAL